MSNDEFKPGQVLDSKDSLFEGGDPNKDLGEVLNKMKNIELDPELKLGILAEVKNKSELLALNEDQIDRIASKYALDAIEDALKATDEEYMQATRAKIDGSMSSEVLNAQKNEAVVKISDEAKDRILKLIQELGGETFNKQKELFKDFDVDSADDMLDSILDDRDSVQL